MRLCWFGSMAAAVPNIVYLMVDDWGWGDFGVHGSRMKTPNLDKLARDGIILDKYYTQPVCSPTRSSLLTGRHPVELGLQHNVILAGQDSGIPKDKTLFTQHLQKCGYTTHLVGKWHCGHGHDWMRPERRGFDTFFGYLQGAEDHYTRIQLQRKDWYGVDFSDGGKPSNETWGHYGTDLYSRRVEKVLNENSEKPFFLYYSMQNVHYPMQSPEHQETKFNWIKDDNRRRYAGMLAAADEAVGDLEAMLRNRGLWENTLLIVTADNGGETRWGGNNYPLRSQKFSVYDGGLRVNAFIGGGAVEQEKRNTKYGNLFHVSDWHDTILEAAECKINTQRSRLSGVSHWHELNHDLSSTSSPPRTVLLHNIDPLKVAKGSDHRGWVNKLAREYNFDVSMQGAIRFDGWKMLTGDPVFPSVPDGNIEPPEEKNQKKLKFNVDWYEQQDIDMFGESNKKLNKMVQLFHIDSDPGEQNETSDVYPSIVEMGISLLSMFNSSSVAPQWPSIDPASNPLTRDDSFRGYWWPWKSDAAADV